jgi:hypothetical protein
MLLTLSKDVQKKQNDAMVRAIVGDAQQRLNYGKN